jgi:uncharacterized membrane protein YphA (DoxX/SURF4 family)
MKNLQKIQVWLTLGFRLILGGVLLVAGAIKVTDPYGSATSVRAYQLLPVHVANFFGFILPFAEIALGVFLIVGIWVRFMALASGALLIAFVIAIGQAWARGISLDCGCFGKGGLIESGKLPVWNYAIEIGRDILLALTGAYLFRFPYGKFGLDKSDNATTGEDNG